MLIHVDEIVFLIPGNFMNSATLVSSRSATAAKPSARGSGLAC